MLGIDHNVIIVLAPTPSDIISESELNTDANSFFLMKNRLLDELFWGQFSNHSVTFLPKVRLHHRSP